MNCVTGVMATNGNFNFRFKLAVDKKINKQNKLF